jgi:phosphonate transport system substrate-binding protein
MRVLTAFAPTSPRPLAHARPLRFATFLAPRMLPVYQRIAAFVGARLRVETELFVGDRYAQAVHEADLSVLCGLPYVELTREECTLEALAAPVLAGDRYGGRPIYFSDVIVHRDSGLRRFSDLRGRSWSFNEPHSQSGYGVVRNHLLRLGETEGFFGTVIETGWHDRSIRLVASGEVDASAVDSHVLELTLRDHPELGEQLRVIDTLGPSTIQPIAATTTLAPEIKNAVRNALIEMHDHPEGRAILAQGRIERFVSMAHDGYDDVRRMLTDAESASFLTLR